MPNYYVVETKKISTSMINQEIVNHVASIYWAVKVVE